MLTLMALALMMQLSDFAPRACQWTGKVVKDTVFSVDQVVFNQSGTVDVTLFGIKNDYNHQGFVMIVQPTRMDSVCPVKALRHYIKRTQYVWPVNGALFLTLATPPTAMSAKTVGAELNSVIRLVGLDASKFTAKSFHPMGATNAVQSGVNPDFIRKVGHWKNADTFEAHYVHTTPPEDMTNNIFGLDCSQENGKINF